jgi:hypothetical protein
MSTPRTPAWAELIQLVPVVSLALPFIVQGDVELERAGLGFIVAAVLTVPASALVAARGHLLNPILVGTAAWLWGGAIAFAIPVEPLARWLANTQAFGLFVAALAVGGVATFMSPQGYVACWSSDPGWVRRASWWLLGVTVIALAWSWWFRADVRLGGGIPFVALNIARRALGRFAPRDD